MGVYDYSVATIAGQTQSLADFTGRVLLLVNTASRCGFTPQYKGLQELYQKHHDAGLEILGFPCNQFGGQEPGTDEEIQTFCEMNYQVTFPLYSKIEVNGAHAHPLYQYLKEQAPGVLGSEAIKWNFTKFLVNRQGTVLKRFAPNVEPVALERAIEEALQH